MSRKFLRPVLVTCFMAVLPLVLGALLGGCAREEGPTSEIRVLPNGLTIVAKESRNSDVVSVQAWVNDGTLYEKADEAGIAHLLARLVLDQTETRGPGELTLAIENVGGMISSGSSHDFVNHAVAVQSEHLDLAIEILADGIENAVFEPERVEREKSAILARLAALDEKPIERANFVFLEKMVGDHPYGRPEQGTRATVERITAEDLAARHAARYVASNMMIVIAGNADPVAAVDRVEALLGDLDEGTPAVPAAEPPQWPTATARVVEHADVHRAYQIIGFPAPGVEHPKSVAMDVLLWALGHGRSSRLHVRLTEELGVARAVSAGWYTKRQQSPIFVWMELSSENIEAAEAATVELMKDLAVVPLEEDELAKAKTLLESEMIFGRETAGGLATYYGYWPSIGGMDFADEYFDRLAAVTAEDIRLLAEEYFGSGVHVAVAVVPEQNK
jgi:zinc protease